jgi:hypothetical protein
MCNLSKHSDHKKNLLENHETVWQELVCHLPIAIFSVSFSMVLLSFLSYFDVNGNNLTGAHLLFHNFHFLHLLFAATGAVLTFRRYSKNVPLGITVGFFVPATFCTLSDAFLPYVSGSLLGIDMNFHWCFLTHLTTVIPFVIMGIINGWFISGHSANRNLFYSQGFHFLHIFISSMASILYLVSFGYAHWWQQMGIIFILLICAVLIPCTLSDIVVPMLFAKLKR